MGLICLGNFFKGKKKKKKKILRGVEKEKGHEETRISRNKEQKQKNVRFHAL